MIGPEGVDPRFFHDVYEGTAPWDIGEPQPEVVHLLEGHHIQGRVLDVGCGTGENAILLAMSGYDVTAIDLVPTAVDKAREAAQERHVDVSWHVGDALRLPELVEGRFDTVLDSGVFHVFGDADRRRYAQALAQVTAPAGRLHVIVFSDEEGGEDGPRRVTRRELEATFRDGWTLEGLRPTVYGIRSRPQGAKAWRGTWVRDGVRTQ